MELVEQRDYSRGAISRQMRTPRQPLTDAPGDEMELGRRDSCVNVGATERLITGLVSGALVALGFRKSPIARMLLTLGSGALAYRAITGYCPAYKVLSLNTAATGTTADLLQGGGIEVVQSVTINRPQHDLYNYWRQLDRLPQVLQHLESVSPIDEFHSRWKVKGPLGLTMEWDAEIFRDEPYELIAWRSLRDSDIDNVGMVRFRPAPIRGTEMEVHINYRAPLGKAGAALARMLGEEPAAQIGDDLRRFKQLMETGEITTTEGQPSGRAANNGFAHNGNGQAQRFGWGTRDKVEEASWESFPASDSPSWTSGCNT